MLAKLQSGLLAVAIESGRVVRWVTLSGAGHHHHHNLLLGLHQALHAQLIERQDLQEAPGWLIRLY